MKNHQTERPDPPRTPIDPDGRYPSEEPRSVELRAKRLLGVLPGAEVQRTRDVIQINWRGERGLVFLVTAEALEIRLPTVEWTAGAYGPAPSSLFWKRAPWDDVESGRGFPALLTEALAARKSEFKICRFCGEEVPPEHRIDEEVCHGCATRHLGVVF